MEPLHMLVTMSSSLKLSAVRGLWLKRDFFSDHCPSYKASYEMEFFDLSTAVEEEMIVRRRMIEKHLNTMRKEREAYEERMEELAKEENNKKSDKSQKSEKKTKILVEIEPPVVDETTYVDVEDEYVTYEFSKFQEDMDRLSPESLNLSVHEVNMRENQILGGIYKLECLLKPSQTKEINFQLFIQLSKNF